jgi:hypothetical protein
MDECIYDKKCYHRRRDTLVYLLPVELINNLKYLRNLIHNITFVEHLSEPSQLILDSKLIANFLNMFSYKS